MKKYFLNNVSLSLLNTFLPIYFPFYVLKIDIQTFITTTDINNINNEIVNNAKIFKISNCEITEL